MSGYAASTSVPVERTRAEIERTLARWGATAFAYGWQEGRAVLSFAAQDRRVHFELPLPQPDERRFTHTASGQRRSLPDGRTVADHAGPAVAEAYASGVVPSVLRLSPGQAPLALGPAS